MTTHSLLETLDESIDYIARALTRIERGEGADVELHNIKVYIVNTLEMIEPDPAIEAAGDDLYRAAADLVAAREVTPRVDGRGGTDGRSAAVQDALRRFQDRLTRAAPSERGRTMGLE